MTRRAAASALVACGLAIACGRERERPAPIAVAPPADAGATRGLAPLDELWFPAAAVIGERVRALADPALRGRGSGTPDEAAAADRLAGWLRAAGLEPAGDGGGYLQAFTRPDGRRSQNVVGVLAGSEPHAGHVVIGAHYDHLGVVDGVLHPGADDNASGTAALTAIAEALARAGQRPRATVVVVGFGSEEDGLYGSAHYVAHPALPLPELRLMINLDMIGRPAFLTSKDYALARAVVPTDAIGALTSPGARDLVALARTAAAPEGRPLVATSDLGPVEDLIRPAIEYRGDHASFAAAGVRYLWLSTSMHDDYHLPSDTADKVDPATIAVVGRIVVRVVRALPPRP